MNTLIHADVFFFITTIWVVIISAVFVVILLNIAYIVNDLRHISKKMREGSNVISEDLHDLHTIIHAEGANVSHIWKYFKHLFSHRQNHKK